MGWPAGTQKLILSPEYLDDQRTEQVSHSGIRKLHLNLTGKTPREAQVSPQKDCSWDPESHMSFKQDSRQNSFATKSFFLGKTVALEEVMKFI